MRISKVPTTREELNGKTVEELLFLSFDMQIALNIVQDELDERAANWEVEEWL